MNIEQSHLFLVLNGSFRFVGGLLFLWLCVAVATGQQANGCPAVEVILPARAINIEEEVSLVARIVGDFNGSVEWKTSSGKILTGQGSHVASFMADEEDAGSNIKVSAKLLGLPDKCLVEVSDTIPVASLPIGDPVDTLGKVGASRKAVSDFLGRLDGYFATVNQTSDYEGLIAIDFYAKDTGQHKIRHLMRIFDHIKFRKLDVSRFTFAVSEGNFREQTTLWTAAPGARIPKYMRSSTMIKGEEFIQKISTLFKNKK